MSAPRFYVVARVVGRDGGMSIWKDRLVELCKVSRTEPYGDSYYWGEDLDGEPDTLWGLEGYTHPIGFFIDHVSSEIFKREMALVDDDKLLRTVQGLGSPDYDLHHYDEFGGFLKNDDASDKDSTTSHVAVHHFWAESEEKRSRVLSLLSDFAQELSRSCAQSALVLKECRDTKLATFWLRFPSRKDWDDLQQSEHMEKVQSELQSSVVRSEIHHIQAFGGHIGIKG